MGEHDNMGQKQEKATKATQTVVTNGLFPEMGEGRKLGGKKRPKHTR